MQFLDQVKIVRSSDHFDEKWYTNRYLDVSMLGMDPAEHFVRYGALMGRSPGEDFDTEFYMSAYADFSKGDHNPLVHYEIDGKKDARPISRQQVLSEFAELERKTSKKWGVETNTVGGPVISYCIPVMGRLDDIRGTLKTNLNAHRSLREKVEFIVVLFGDYAESYAWLNSEFPQEIRDGLLRVELDERLDSWHFGKAKNAFRAHMRGRVYSSLDGDNFVTLDETNALLSVYDKYDGYFIAHHFSGHWGDGTSGRLSMPASIYRSIGYEETMLPRQFDEIDAILAAMRKFPALPFLCIDSKNSIFVKSEAARIFYQREALPNRICEFDGGKRLSPLNPRGEDYTKQNRHFQEMGNFNSRLSGFLRSRFDKNRKLYSEQLTEAKHRLIEALPKEMIPDMFFRCSDRPNPKPLTRGDVALFVCLKDEHHFIPSLIAHYRDLGVRHFFIIDDGSEIPVEQVIQGEDIHVFHPKVGNFRTSKTLWIEALMKFYLSEGNWFLTIDADEFIHLPKAFPSLKALSQHLEARQLDFVPGLMIDMLPDPSATVENLSEARTNFRETFTWCCNVQTAPEQAYGAHPSIAWGFGKYAQLSWRIDARFHAFGTVDSLRKIPFIRYSPDRHLNQGFHTLHYSNSSLSPKHEIWEGLPILEVRHYKLVKLFSDDARERMLKLAANYHDRTAQNISSIFEMSNDGARQTLEALDGKISHINEVSDWLNAMSAG